LGSKNLYRKWKDALTENVEQPVKATLTLIRSLGYHPNIQQISEYILSHPAYPSLLSISDCLKDCGIENAAVRVEKENIDDYPLPFMVHSAKGFIVLTKIGNERIEYIDENDEISSFSRELFLKKWDGVALLINDPGKEALKKENKFLMKNHKPPVLLLLTGITLLLAIFIIPTLQYALLMMLKVSGVIISGLLLWYQVDKNNPAIKKICGKEAGSGSGCTAVLDSGAAKIFKGFSWSEAGFFYFTGGLLTLLLLPAAFDYIAWLNILALPYIVYSIIYQKFIIKQWCKLCLSVQAILLLEFTVALLFGTLNHFPVLTWTTGIQVASLFILPAIIWFAIKPILEKHVVLKQELFESTRVKRDPEVIHTLLEKQKKVDIDIKGMGIELGDPAASHTIVAVSNPYCPACSTAHEGLKELMDEKDLRLQIIFTASNDPADKKAAPAKHLMAIAAKGNEDMTRKALDDWYLSEKKDYSEFAEKYKLNGELKKQDQQIAKMDEWCKETGISATPTIFVDGYQLPDNYKAQDLKYLFSD